MAIKVGTKALQRACKEIIETILYCLPNARKGTVYSIGNPPDIIARRITSGVIDHENRTISWGLNENSDYDPPGKKWIEYRDEPDRPLEAMAWCVEKQKSWTVEDHKQEKSPLRKLTNGDLEDCYHMEPVLIRKRDLSPNNSANLVYPENYKREILWQDSEYVVSSVIKISFSSNSIKIGSPETRFIKRLSRALGTELLSYQLREESLEAIREVAQDKIDSCNLLADTLRNAVTKSGVIFSLIKSEIGFLREQWERALLQNSDFLEMKREAVLNLNELVVKLGIDDNKTGNALIDLQNRFLDLNLPPERAENWVKMQIEEKWDGLLKEKPQGTNQIQKIRGEIDKLKKSLHFGTNPKFIEEYDKIPEPIKNEWVALIYSDTDRLDFDFLDRLIQLLKEPSFNLPYKEKSRKALNHLMTLAAIMGQLENNTNVVLRQLLNGGNGGRGLLKKNTNSKLLFGDNGGRRKGIERRRNINSSFTPERRIREDRRKSKEMNE